jgi:hypothetical protein
MSGWREGCTDEVWTGWEVGCVTDRRTFVCLVQSYVVVTNECGGKASERWFYARDGVPSVGRSDALFVEMESFVCAVLGGSLSGVCTWSSAAQCYDYAVVFYRSDGGGREFVHSSALCPALRGDKWFCGRVVVVMEGKAARYRPVLE